MTSIRKAALVCVTGALMALPLTAGAQTGPRNQDTYFTFSQAVELPGTTLPAGRYFFQLMDSDSNRHIVKVMSEDKSKLHTTLLAIPYYTNDRPPDEPQVRFMETPTAAGGGQAANAIKIWFYPGNRTGHEFIYPRSQATRIASRTGEPVLTTKTETAQVPETVADAELTRVDRSGQNTAVDTSNRATDVARAEQPEPAPQPRQAEPTTDRTPSAAPAPQPRPVDRTADSAARDTERTDLPETAGFLPLLALIGIGSVIGSRMLRRSRMRV
jgi:hypothetical protein